MRICLILVDGMRPDSLGNIKEAQEMMRHASYTMEAKTVFPSVTLPCHISLFHSVDPVRHGTITNVYTPQVRPINGLFDVLAQFKKKTALFYDWEQIRDISRPGSLSYAAFSSGKTHGYENTIETLSDDAIKALKEKPYDCTFIYMGLTDEVGHAKGWMGEDYLLSVQKSWQMIQKLYQELPEDYVFIVTADHGGHDRSHGTELIADMTIPIIAFSKSKEISFHYENATIKDIAPTIASLLSVEPDEDWEGKSLL